MFKFLSLLLLLPFTAFGQVQGTVAGNYTPGFYSQKNYVKNPSCFANVRFITASSGSVSRSSASKVSGSSCDIDAASSGITYKWDLNNFDNGRKGQNCEAIFTYTGDASLYKAYVERNSLRIGSEVQLSDATQGGAVAYGKTQSLGTFPCGDNSSSTYIVIESTSASAAAIKVAEMYGGAPVNIGDSLIFSDLGTESWTDNQANATTSVRIFRIGSSIKVIGKTSFTGAASGALDITLPTKYTPDTAIYPLAGGNTWPFGRARHSDNGSGDFIGDVDYYAANTVRVTLENSSSTFVTPQNISSTLPITWASGDWVNWDAEYKVADWASVAASTKLETLPASYSAYHGNDCSFVRSGATFGDFTADASCTFTSQINKNIGTVTTAGSSLPGLVITPNKTGNFLLISTFSGNADASTQTAEFRLTDGTNVYDEVPMYSSGNTRVAITLTALVQGVINTPVTIKLQAQTPSGNININALNGTRAVTWKLISLDQAFPQPVLTSAVPTVTRLTSGSGTYNWKAGVQWIEVEMVGGGGGGGGTGGSGGNGGDTTFGSWVAGKGNGGASGGSAGVGTANTTSTGTVLINLTGSSGGTGQNTPSTGGGPGGAGPWGGAGQGGFSAGGLPGVANSGSGGGGAASSGAASQPGGGAGSYLKFIPATATSFSYAVGSGGTAGSGNGSAGGSGVIIIKEFYQ